MDGKKIGRKSSLLVDDEAQTSMYFSFLVARGFVVVVVCDCLRFGWSCLLRVSSWSQQFRRIYESRTYISYVGVYEVASGL